MWWSKAGEETERALCSCTVCYSRGRLSSSSVDLIFSVRDRAICSRFVWFTIPPLPVVAHIALHLHTSAPTATRATSCRNGCTTQGKAAAAAAAAAGIPLIGRPVVKNAKDSKATPAAGGRTRGTTTASGMPIIGRPVVSAAVPPPKAAKVPGLGDSPQASTQLQQQQQNQAGRSPGGQQQQSTMAAAARMGTAGPQTPGQTMQVSTAQHSAL